MRRAVFIACVVLLVLLPQLPVPEFWITQANYIGLYALVVLISLFCLFPFYFAFVTSLRSGTVTGRPLRSANTRR